MPVAVFGRSAFLLSSDELGFLLTHGLARIGLGSPALLCSVCSFYGPAPLAGFIWSRYTPHVRCPPCGCVLRFPACWVQPGLWTVERARGRRGSYGEPLGPRVFCIGD